MPHPIIAVRQWSWERYRALSVREHRLEYLFLELTRRCNLACRHCGSDCSARSGMAELSGESWLSIIDHLQARYRPWFVLTGGEVLVSPDFFPIIEHLKLVGAAWGMVSNGFALDSTVFQRCVDNGLTSLTLSVDGLEARHRWLRRHPESWSRLMTALDLLGDSAISNKDVVSCVFPANLDDLDKLAEMLLSKGINGWRLFRIFPRGQAANTAELALDQAQTCRLIEWIRLNRPRYAKKGLRIALSCEGWLPFALDRQVRDEPFFCRAGVSFASILADGTITGCNNNALEFAQGSLLSDSFDEIWEKGFGPYRDRQWLKTGVCASCTNWKQCQGGSLHLREVDGQGPLFCLSAADQ